MSTPVPRDKLVGMQVVDTTGSIIGIVKDLAVTVGEGKITLIVTTSSGSETEISWKDVQAAKDIVLLAKTIETPPIAVSVMQQPSRPAEVSCSRCSAKLPSTARFCAKCGMKLR